MPPVQTPELLEAVELALAAPTDRKRMLVIVNPYATTVSDRLKNLVVYALQGRYDVDAAETEARGHATELCREAAREGYDVVVAFGGDGTVSEAANGLKGSATPLCCLPGGATNVYCKMLGIPGDIVDATEHVLALADAWHPRRVDLADVTHYAGEDAQPLARSFLFSAGVGLDASVVRRVDAHPRAKTRLRQWYFTWAAMTTFNAEYLARPPKLEVRAGDAVLHGVTALVQNGDPYTYFGNRPVHVARDIALDDGLLAGAVLARASPLAVPTMTARLLADGLEVTDHRRVAGWSGLPRASVRSTDGRAVPLQVDGDHIGDVVRADFSVSPRALTVLA